MQYAVVIEHQEGSNYSAYVPGLPGCVSTEDTLEEIGRNIRKRLSFISRA
jgi:predicted RNase H-like HicB family nuclease